MSSRGPAERVSAVEQGGEGIFSEFREDRVAPWATSVARHEHGTAVERGCASATT
jgi:hypothetical protein